MKGTDVSETDRQQAAQFLKIVSGVEWLEDDVKVTTSRTEMIRLIAWYGRIRANGVEAPGHIVAKRALESMIHPKEKEDDKQ